MTVFDANSLLAAGPNGPAGPTETFCWASRSSFSWRRRCCCRSSAASPRPAKRQSGPNNPPKTPTSPQAPATPKKDNPFRNEIEAFLEEVGKRRAAGERLGAPSSIAARASRGSQKRLQPPSSSRRANRSCCGRSEPATATGPSRRKPSSSLPACARPGKKLPLAERPARRIWASNPHARRPVSRRVADDHADAERSGQLGGSRRAPAPGRAERRGRRGAGTNSDLRRSQSDRAAPAQRRNVRTAIVINEILGPPKGLRRRR